MTVRLSMSSFAGTARTLVAVGTARLACMLLTTRAAGPLSGTVSLAVAAGFAGACSPPGLARLSTAGAGCRGLGCGRLALAYGVAVRPRTVGRGRRLGGGDPVAGRRGARRGGRSDRAAAVCVVPPLAEGAEPSCGW